eukprot:EG_transcript_21372
MAEGISHHIALMAQHVCKYLSSGSLSLSQSFGLLQEYFAVVPKEAWAEFAVFCLLQLRSIFANSNRLHALMLYVLRATNVEMSGNSIDKRLRTYSSQLEDLRIGLSTDRSYHARIVYLFLSLRLGKEDVNVVEELEQLAWLDPSVAHQASQLLGLSIESRRHDEEPLVDRQLKLIHVYTPTWHTTPPEKLHRLTALFLRSLQQTRESFHSAHEDPDVFVCPSEATLTAADLDELVWMLEDEKEQDEAFQVCAAFPLPVPRATLTPAPSVPAFSLVSVARTGTEPPLQRLPTSHGIG